MYPIEINQPYKSRLLFFVKLDYQKTTALKIRLQIMREISSTVTINTGDAREMIATVINVIL